MIQMRSVLVHVFMEIYIISEGWGESNLSTKNILDGSKLRVKELRMAAVLQFYFTTEPRLCCPELHGATESSTLCLVRQHIQHFS